MKKTLIALLALGGIAMGADLVAEWDGFTNLTSTISGKSYELTLTGGASVTALTGVLNVSHTEGNNVNITPSATIDLSSAGLTMDSGITVSITLSNLGIHGGVNLKNPGAIFGLATEGYEFAFMAGYNDNSNNANRAYSVAYDGSPNKVTKSTGEDWKGTDPCDDTQVNFTITISNNITKLYVDGESLGNGTFDTTANDWTDDTITMLSLASYAGLTKNGACDATIYDLAVYRGAMTAQEVRNLVIPEPTTATLSLLALAGLAARRRRR